MCSRGLMLTAWQGGVGGVPHKLSGEGRQCAALWQADS